MSFTFKNGIVDGSLNLGTLDVDGQSVDTPCLVVSTYVGGLNYTTPDCLGADSEIVQLGQLEISDLIRKDFGDLCLSELRSGHQTLILSSRNVVGNVAATDANGINIDSFNGRIHISVNDYLKRISLDKPAAVVSFSDEVDLGAGRKRLSKAVERSMTWFSEMSTSPAWLSSHQPFLFGVVIPVPEVPAHIAQYSASLLSKGAQGLVVGCSHMGESEEIRVRNIKEVRSAAGSRVPVMIQGADSLRQILLAMVNGVDLVSTNYPSLITVKGFAINWTHRREHTLNHVVSGGGSSTTTTTETLTHKKKRSVFDLVPDEELEEQEQRRDAPKKRKTNEVEESSVPAVGASKGTEDKASAVTATGEGGVYPKRPKHIQKPPPASERPTCSQHRPIERCTEEDQTKFEKNLMLLWNNEYERDTSPLMADCKCHACKHHTRAYIHHLLIAKEMLAEVLLYHHNAYQLNQMMKMARERRSQSVEAFHSWVEETLRSL